MYQTKKCTLMKYSLSCITIQKYISVVSTTSIGVFYKNTDNIQHLPKMHN